MISMRLTTSGPLNESEFPVVSAGDIAGKLAQAHRCADGKAGTHTRNESQSQVDISNSSPVVWKAHRAEHQRGEIANKKCYA